MYRYWFDHIKGLTPVKKRILYETFREAEILYHAPEDTIRKVTGIEDQDVLAVTESKRSWNLEGAWMRLQERGISLVTLEDDEYPAKLARIVAPPYALYYRGHLPDESHRSVAIVGARGRSAYGSQVARALAKHTPVLVLDDSTSALDMETEYAIQQTLTRLPHTTKLIIAHRISAVRHADEIIVLENGHIAERGTHEELLALHGLYYQTWQAQFGMMPDQKEVTDYGC